MAARAGDGGRLRASHADREQVIGVLKAAFVHGVLDKDEFDLRVSQTFASRTYADLAAVTADIPAGLSLARPPGPAGGRTSRHCCGLAGWPERPACCTRACGRP